MIKYSIRSLQNVAFNYLSSFLCVYIVRGLGILWPIGRFPFSYHAHNAYLSYCPLHKYLLTEILYLLCLLYTFFIAFWWKIHIFIYLLFREIFCPSSYGLAVWVDSLLCFFITFFSWQSVNIIPSRPTTWVTRNKVPYASCLAKDLVIALEQELRHCVSVLGI